MIVKIGNIFDSNCRAICNTVNCVGVMGKGIALDFKKRYPKMFEDYVDKCKKGEVIPGKPYFFEASDGQIILNFPTKSHWKLPTQLSYVIDGLDWFIDNYKSFNITSIAFPPLGCGNGGLKWEVVGPIMYQKLSSLPINIEVYAPYGTSQQEISKEFLSNPTSTQDLTGKFYSRLNDKWLLLLQVVKEVNEGYFNLKVGRTIFQKICYVLTRNGVDTGFSFCKGTYGPFSNQIKESITILANANLVTEQQLGKMILLQVTDSFKLNKSKYTAPELEAVAKTTDLFLRIKNTDQAEMVSTVLFSFDQLAKSNKSVIDTEVYDYVVDWKPYWKGKKDFDICNTIQNMDMLSLIDIEWSGLLINTEEAYYP